MIVTIPTDDGLNLLQGYVQALDVAGDRKVDLDLARAFVPGVIVMRSVRDDERGHRNEEFTHWKYTELFDHALGLMTMTLPGWWVQHLGRYTGDKWGARIEAQGHSVGIVYGPSPATALLLTMLRAHRENGTPSARDESTTSTGEK